MAKVCGCTLDSKDCCGREEYREWQRKILGFPPGDPVIKHPYDLYKTVIFDPQQEIKALKKRIEQLEKLHGELPKTKDQPTPVGVD